MYLGYDYACDDAGREKLLVLLVCFTAILFYGSLPLLSYYMEVRMFLVWTLLAIFFSAPLFWGRRRDASTFFAFLTAYVCILTYGYGVFTGAFLAMTGGMSWLCFFLMRWDRAFHVNVWGFLIWFALFSSGLHYCFESKGKGFL